jgi:acetyl esterase/lipase
MASAQPAAAQTLTYATHDGVALVGDLYMPAGDGPFPVMVAVHGGGWIQGARGAMQHWGRHFAANGIAAFSVSYRFATAEKKTFPQAAQDVMAAVQFVRGKAAALKLDRERVGLIGVSAGAHLSALAALAGSQPPFKGGYPHDEFASESTAVKVLVGVYGVYDLRAMWQQFHVQSPTMNNVALHLGAAPMQDSRPYFEASPINHATFANNKLAVYLCSGTEDDLVDRHAQTDAFMLALKQAQFFVRSCIVPGAGHYWMNDPIDEPGSYGSVLAPRLMRFLAEKL